jgi:hypothetical protein
MLVRTSRAYGLQNDSLMERSNSTMNTITRLTSMCAGILLTVFALTADAQVVKQHGDDVTIRGCVTSGGRSGLAPQQMLVWSRGDMMLSNVMTAGEGDLLNQHVFYWLNHDKDLTKHVGQMVEVKGDLGDFKKGEIEVKKDGDFTNIEMKLGGKTEKARVPTSWFGAAPREGEFDIVSRKIDVDDVKVLGACPAR